MVTYEDALKAREFWHMTLTNADGTAWRARRTGATKTWVTRPGEFKVPVKRGMNDSFYITPASAHVWCTPEKWPAEHVLFAVCGDLRIPPSQRRANVILAPRTEHSAKPEHFYDLVEQVSPGPYLELFARRHRMFWDVWGNESANTAQMAGPA